MIIVGTTGCDGSGKTTIVKKLVEKLKYETFHFGPPKNMEDGKQQYFNFLKNIENGENNYVLDRFHEGEWVYSKLYRGYIADYMRDFEREIIKNHNFLHVYVKAELNTIIERTRKRGEDFVKEEHFQTVLNLFDEYMNKQALPYVEIDTTNSDTENDVKRIINSINKVNDIWNIIKNSNCPGTIQTPALPRGNIEAEIMIVGQNPGKKAKFEYSTTWQEIGLSAFMIDITRKAGIHRKSWYTNIVPYPTSDNKINKQQIESASHIIDLEINLINPKKIIALGNIAYETLNQKYGKNYEIIKVPHPSYIRRFQIKKLEEYINQFKV